MFSDDSWERWRRKLYRHAVSATWGRAQDAEDCVSEAVCNYMVRVQAGKLIDHPFWYLIGAVKNKARDQRRYAHYREAPLYAGDLADDPTTEVEERLDKEAQLATLKDHQDYPWLISYYGEHKGSRSRAERVRAVRARRGMRLKMALIIDPLERRARIDQGE